MPIANLTDRARMPRLGKIHLGIKVKKEGTDTEYPKATDYFVLPDEPPELKKILGDKPKEIPIIIPVEDLDKWASQYYRNYSRSRGLICKGDGITCQSLVDKKTGALANRDSKAEDITMKQGNCAGRECPAYQAERCREVMMLQFMIPNVPGLGIWQVDTSSYNSIMNINSMDQMLRALFLQVSMIPVTLTLEPQQVVGKDKKTKTVHCLNIRLPQMTPNQAIKMRRDLLKLPMPQATLAVADDEPPEPEPLQDLDFTAEPGEIKPLTCKDCEKWAECQGVVVDECAKRMAEQAEKDADNLFHEDPPHAKEAVAEAKKAEKPKTDRRLTAAKAKAMQDARAKGIPATVEELYAWVAEMMKWKDGKPARSWLVNKCKITEDMIDKDPTAAYHEAKALMGW